MLSRYNRVAHRRAYVSSGYSPQTHHQSLFAPARFLMPLHLPRLDACRLGLQTRHRSKVHAPLRYLAHRPLSPRRIERDGRMATTAERIEVLIGPALHRQPIIGTVMNLSGTTAARTASTSVALEDPCSAFLPKSALQVLSVVHPSSPTSRSAAKASARFLARHFR